MLPAPILMIGFGREREREGEIRQGRKQKTPVPREGPSPVRSGLGAPATYFSQVHGVICQSRNQVTE